MTKIAQQELMAELTKVPAIKSKKTAVAMLEQSVELKEKAEALMEKHGIQHMLDTADNMKKQATEYCITNKVEQLDIKGGYGKLIESAQERILVGTKADMPDDPPKGLKPLRSLVTKEVWMRITKRVPDVEAIEEAISEGELTVDEIQPAYYERMRKPYMRVFRNSDG